MATAWINLKTNSNLSSGTAWEHLKNQYDGSYVTMKHSLTGNIVKKNLLNGTVLLKNTNIKGIINKKSLKGTVIKTGHLGGKITKKYLKGVINAS